MPVPHLTAQHISPVSSRSGGQSCSDGALRRLSPRCSPAPLKAPHHTPSLAMPWCLKRECEAALIKI